MLLIEWLVPAALILVAKAIVSTEQIYVREEYLNMICDKHKLSRADILCDEESEDKGELITVPVQINENEKEVDNGQDLQV